MPIDSARKKSGKKYPNFWQIPSGSPPNSRRHYSAAFRSIPQPAENFQTGFWKKLILPLERAREKSGKKYPNFWHIPPGTAPNGRQHVAAAGIFRPRPAKFESDFGPCGAAKTFAR